MSSASFGLKADGSAFGGANFHLIFTPAYRRPVFQDAEIKNACEREALAVAERLGVELAASEFGRDHWHLFVVGCKNFSAPVLARRFKGATSRAVRRGLWPRVKQFLWGNHFWSHGYFFETTGRVTSETVRYYIERGQQKHWPQPVQTKISAYPTTPAA